MNQKYHPLIQKTKIELEQFDRNKKITWEEKRKFNGTCLPISVEPKLRSHAFDFMNDLIVYIEKKGHIVTFKYDRCHIEMYGQLTEINLRQKYFRKRKKNASGFSMETYEKSMFLEFQVGSHTRKGWLEKDTKKLKDYLTPIYDYIEKDSLKWAEYGKQKGLEEEEREMQLKIEEAKANQKQLEENNLNQLITDAENFRIANNIRSYLNVVEINSRGSIDENKLKVYLEWASTKADEMDPTIDFILPNFQ